MAVLTIRTFPDPILKERCAEVTRFDGELHQLLDDMFETMSTEGIGLAANQVGHSVRLFVMDVPLEGDQRTGRLEIINPRILARRGEVKYEEGCLSFPGMYESVNRAAEIDLAWQDRQGQHVSATMRGLVAICAQHEFDHLEGITFIDRLSPLKRRIAMRDYLREHREAIEDKQFRSRPKGKRQIQTLSSP